MIIPAKRLSAKKTAPTIANKRKSLLATYLAYADNKSKEKMLFYLKVIILLPGVYMVLAIFAMAILTPHYIWFIGLSMSLFFANVVAHISETKSRVYLPIYHATIALHILIPLATYLLRMIN